MKIMPLVLTACLLASLGCDSIDFNGLDTDVLTVSVATVGTDLDPDGYLLSITGEQDEPIGINETRRFTVLTVRLTVELSDIAANCVATTNPLTIDVTGPTTVNFFVECT